MRSDKAAGWGNEAFHEAVEWRIEPAIGCAIFVNGARSGVPFARALFGRHRKEGNPFPANSCFST